MEGEKFIYKGNPADSHYVEGNKDRAQETDIDKAANELVRRYQENISTGATERGIASKGLVDSIQSELGGKALDEDKIHDFADRYAVSPILVSRILGKLDKMRH